MSRRTEPALSDQINTLSALLDHLQIKQWDYLIVGDGSGTTWQHPFGWAAVLFDRVSLQRKDFYGAGNCGTNFTAELMAVLHPLSWLVANRSKLAGKRLHVVTDCQPLLSKTGAFNKQLTLWAGIESTKATGLSIKWHWLPRSIVAANRWADRKANAARLQLKQLEENT